MASFLDDGTFNLRDLTDNKLVAKVHVENALGDVAGGRSYTIHYALVKSPVSDNGWVVYQMPTSQLQKSFKWEHTGETFAQFLAWMHDTTRRPKLRYVKSSVREQDDV